VGITERVLARHVELRSRRCRSGGLLTCVILRDKLSVIVKHMLKVSDNDSAETLLRMTALAAGRPATFEGGTAVVREVLTRYGVSLDNFVIHGGEVRRGRTARGG
jgi:hypothetical protein